MDNTLTKSNARYRVVSDNDYAGDPDGLFQLAHLALSSDVEILAVIGSNFIGAEAFGAKGDPAEASAKKALEVLELCGRMDVEVVTGYGHGLAEVEASDSDAAAKLIELAMADDDRPLFVLCGGSLTTVAAAWLREPAIAKRMTLVWIGGPEYPGLASPPPNPDAMEYNLSIDVMAAQVIFNQADIPIWQFPRNAYRQANVSVSELLLNVKPHGPLGEYLTRSITQLQERAIAELGLNLGETYILGDNPLVLACALQSNFHPDTSSSDYVIKPRLEILGSGNYGPDTGHSVRVFTSLDNRLMFADLYAKLALFAKQTT